MSWYNVIVDTLKRGDVEQKRLGSAVATTVFDVYLAYGEESRNYRAQASWLPPAKERDDADFALVDHLAPFNLLSLVDDQKFPLHPDFALPASPGPKAPPAPSYDRFDIHDGDLPPKQDSKAMEVTCEDTSISMTRSKSTYDRADHFGPVGAHNAGFGANYECSCEASSRQDCTPDFIWKDCDDWGPVGENRPIDCHVISYAGFDQYSEESLTRI